MKRYSPGASVNSDYSHICDCCEKDDGRHVLIWDPLPGRKGNFALCFECLERLDHEYNQKDFPNPPIIFQRILIPESLRNKVFERDKNKCVKCNSTENLQLDHIIPFSKGGKTEESNLQTLCRKCNLEKRDHA